MATVELLTTPQPHLVPGYAGFCPQYRYACGETYGNVTHKLLIDPNINHAEKLVLSTQAADDYQMRPSKNDLDVINLRTKRLDATYKYPIVPGYQGFMPNFNGRLGQRYTVSAVEGLADFERQQLKDKSTMNHLRNVIGLQNGMSEPRSLEDREMLKTEVEMPLMSVRPDWARGIRNSRSDEKCRRQKNHHPSPYFKENDDDEKYFMKGYTGHIPHSYEHFGGSHKQTTNNALRDFTTNYRSRLSVEWAPASVPRPEPPSIIQPRGIYLKDVGMLPNYLGHIPGAAFRYGKTFGLDSRDAKRWLRGDYSD